MEEVFEGSSVGYFCLRKPEPAVGGDACNRRVTNELVANQLSIDGVQSDICQLGITTCPALSDFETDEFSGSDCGIAGAGSDALCGAERLDDGVCVSQGQVDVTFHCRIRCESDADCPLRTLCRAGLCEG
jgi:hypothetical protein